MSKTQSQRGRASRAKGQRGEREFATFMQQHGIEARRGQQFSGSTDSPDVVHSIPGVHLEIKRTEKLSLWDALAQAEKDAGPDKVPIVMHRKNHKPWVAIMDAGTLLEFLKGKLHD